MKLRRNISPVLLILLTVLPSCKTNRKVSEIDSVKVPWSVKMANSEMKRFPALWMVDFQKEKRWNYTQGLEGLAFLRLSEVTGNKIYFNYAKGFADSLIDANGRILNYKMTNYNIDQVNPGRMIFILYDKTNDPRYRIVIDTLRQQLRTQPRTPEGGFWHKKVYPNQMWLDGLYMGEPFYAEYAKRYNEPDDFSDIINQFRLAASHTYDPVTGLYRHAWDSSKKMPWADKETGQSPHAWGRAMGWFAMAIVDALDYIPEDQPGRGELITTLNTLVEGIVKVQDPVTGGWYQVPDRSGDQGNYIETSCTSMFTYSILKGIRMGYLNDKYLVNARMAYQGLIKNFITTNVDGTVTLTRVCSVAGLGGNPYRDGSYEYYINEQIRDNDPKGVAPFIMASIEYENISK
jgi:unsaturated rhamnogalacturonyl hydrolase